MCDAHRAQGAAGRLSLLLPGGRAFPLGCSVVVVAGFPSGGFLMPDAHVLLSSMRDELATLNRRRAELRGQLEELDRQHDRLATTVSVLDERVGAVAPKSGSSDSLDDVPLTDRILDALGTTGLRRADMLRIFMAQGFTDSAIDSALSRLTKRRAVRRQGKRVLHAEPPAPSSDAHVSVPGAASSPGADAAGGGSGDLSASGGVSGSAPAAGVAGAGAGADDSEPQSQAS